MCCLSVDVVDESFVWCGKFVGIGFIGGPVLSW